MTRRFKGVRAAQWLSLAATPAFATMTLLAVMNGDGHAAAHHLVGQALTLNEMGLMYLLMSIFHSAPWLNLKILRRFERRHHDGRAYLRPE